MWVWKVAAFGKPLLQPRELIGSGVAGRVGGLKALKCPWGQEFVVVLVGNVLGLRAGRQGVPLEFVEVWVTGSVEGGQW